MKKKLADEIGKAYLRLHSKQGYQPQADKYMWTDATNKPVPTPPPPTSGSNEIQTAKQLRAEVLDAIEKTWGEQAINKMLAESMENVHLSEWERDHIQMLTSREMGEWLHRRDVRRDERKLEKIKAEIEAYEQECFMSCSEDKDCAVCNTATFGSIYRIIDKYKEKGRLIK